MKTNTVKKREKLAVKKFHRNRLSQKSLQHVRGGDGGYPWRGDATLRANDDDD